MAALLVAYQLVCGVNYEPWAMAGRISRQVVDALARQPAAVMDGADVYVVGVPDNYGGAYVFRNGLTAATNIARDRNDSRVIRVPQDGFPPSAPARKSLAFAYDVRDGSVQQLTLSDLARRRRSPDTSR